MNISHNTIKQITPNQGKPWTSYDISLLRSCYHIKMPLHYICERLGRMPNSILAQMIRQGLIQNRRDYPGSADLNNVFWQIWSPFDLQALTEAYREGQSVLQLADTFDTTERTMELRLFYMGLSQNPPEFILKSK